MASPRRVVCVFLAKASGGPLRAVKHVMLLQLQWEGLRRKNTNYPLQDIKHLKSEQYSS